MKPGRIDYKWNYLGENGEVPKEFADSWNEKVTCDKVINVTYTQLQNLMSACQLCPGTTYRISGFNKNMLNGGSANPHGYLPQILYDDGTNKGVTIYMDALTKCEMATEGYGEFYNPNYYKEEDYHNLDITGNYGIWDGDNPLPSNVLQYNVGDIVFWGGYAWINKTGNVGIKINNFELSSADWGKLPYDFKPEPDARDIYKRVIDEITVDWYYGIVVERHDVRNQIRVNYTPDTYLYLQFYLVLYNDGNYSPISAIPWGLTPDLKINRLSMPFDPASQKIQMGLQSVSVNNSYVDFINFKGKRAIGVNVYDSVVSRNYWGRSTLFYLNTILNFSHVNSNQLYVDDFTAVHPQSSFGTECIIANNTIEGLSKLSNNELRDGAQITNNIITKDSGITNNRNIKSFIRDNSLNNNGTISLNTLNGASILAANDVNTFSTIVGNYLLECSYLSSNIINNGSEVRACTFTGGSQIIHNHIENESILRQLVLTICDVTNNYFMDKTTLRFLTVTSFTMKFCKIRDCFFNFSTSIALGNKGINYLHAERYTLPVSLDTATIIFINTEKKLFRRADFTGRLMYYDTNDTPIIVDIDA